MRSQHNPKVPYPDFRGFRSEFRCSIGECPGVLLLSSLSFDSHFSLHLVMFQKC